jgi:hypothetical protein
MTTVSLVEDITMKAAELPLELQREVLQFIQFLAFKMNNGGAAQSTKSPETIAPDTANSTTKAPFRSVMGALARPGFDVTPEDIAEVRREMWQNFPREEPR